MYFHNTTVLSLYSLPWDSYIL